MGGSGSGYDSGSGVRIGAADDGLISISMARSRIARPRNRVSRRGQQDSITRLQQPAASACRLLRPL